MDASRHDRRLAFWLLSCCLLVFGMVVLGGVTRLTGSGLSMVDWRPLLGWLPPLSPEDWDAVFALYQHSPEFRSVNAHMDVESFKGIFWLEYLHRLLGRTLGLVFLLPFLYFLARGVIGWRQTPRYLVMFVLGGLQGVLGWYMVKSGLIDVPRVSPYRLTAHLLLAVIILIYMFWVALGLLAGPAAPRPHPWYRRTLALTALIGVTIASGGFVAGLKAGHAFNTFPTMGGYWIPPGLAALEPAWRNLFENVTTVQFDHRLLALITLLAVVGYGWGALRGAVPAGLRSRVVIMLVTVLVQVSLGIATLLMGVPVFLASAHQAVAIILLVVALSVCHGLSRVRAHLV